ncbi:MAG: hypothetical protein US52_C0066G0002 [candidate division WS6 bacterium GW2011_GWA2_37_6]|uniref:Uncharacterized protein n=1 Tax=candidate division WS6 bacterium GW2011_GWA2_37_6 TaxID=1619087 RepID=A0A0G0GW16_9BACT|nr:MAG: hypothetical protein US52_C0066G0002 [candidate division WS6 bacterium GW2011_GWA2_37_6]
MRWKKTLFIVYSWATVVIWTIVIFWFSSLESLRIYSDDYSLLIERLTFLLSYAFLLLLVFRALIATFRLNIDRLSFARNKKEAQEDKEFVIIVETLLLTNAIFISAFIAMGNYQYLETITGRVNDIYSFLSNLTGILIAALITYSWPIINTVEMRLAKRIFGAILPKS